MRTYPYLVYRLVPGFYSNRPINFAPTNGEAIENGITVCWNGEPYDANGNITSEARSKLQAIGIEEQKKSRLRVCLVYSQNDCDYIEPGGDINPFAEPPQMSMKLVDGEYEVSIGDHEGVENGKGRLSDVSFTTSVPAVEGGN